jgi:hypothetical protein
MPASVTRRLVAAASLVLLAGCGQAAGAAAIGGGGAPAPRTTIPPTPASSPTAVPAVAPATEPVPTPAPHPTMPPPAARTFAITPLLAGGAAGSVVAVSSASGVRYRLTVTGLVPGSAHTIHDHAGSCASANRSVHLAVLATATANSRGVIVVEGSLPAFYFDAARIVIVYDTARPVLITGCAMV